MKKLLSLSLCAVLICMMFSGCGPSAKMTEDNINATVDTVMTALKDFDTEKLKKYIDSPTLDTIYNYAEEHSQFSDLGKAIFESLEYEIKSVDLEAATVTVSVTNKDLEETAGSFATRLKKSYTPFQLLTKLNDEAFLDRQLMSIKRGIDSAEIKPAKEITISIEQSKKNLVLIFDETAENAVSGGALSAIKEIYS